MNNELDDLLEILDTIVISEPARAVPPQRPSTPMPSTDTLTQMQAYQLHVENFKKRMQARQEQDKSKKVRLDLRG